MKIKNMRTKKTKGIKKWNIKRKISRKRENLILLLKKNWTVKKDVANGKLNFFQDLKYKRFKK